VVTFDYLHITHTDAVDVSIDVAKCFDNMIEACENLSCRQHGADTQYLQLHAATQQQFRYHVKHAQGVSTGYNQHSPTDPWYGAGQGAGDACPRWIVQANSITLAYLTKAKMWQLTSPDTTDSIQQGLDMFVDDTDLMSVATAKQSTYVPIKTAQDNLTLWNDILQASGGELNPSKCVWFHFFWRPDSRGMLHLTMPLATTPPIMLAVHNDPPVLIKRLEPSKAHRYLGVQITANGDYRTELQLFQQRNARFIGLLHQCPFPHRDVTVIYKQCYLPTVSYPLPATFMPVAKVYKIQSPATSVFFSKMGYPCTFPRAVVYAASDRGGLGFRHLGYEQGIQKCLQLLKHIRTNTSTGRSYQIILQHYQLTAGISRPILQDTRPLPWSFAPWFDNLRALLHSIDGQIIIRDPWHISPRRQADRFIMEDALAYHLSPKQLQQIQNVRLYLRITLLSEITNHSRTHIITAMLYPAPREHHKQHYRQNASSLQWP